MKRSSHQANKKQEKENPVRSHDTLTKEKEDENLRKEKAYQEIKQGSCVKMTPQNRGTNWKFK